MEALLALQYYQLSGTCPMELVSGANVVAVSTPFIPLEGGLFCLSLELLAYQELRLLRC